MGGSRISGGGGRGVTQKLSKARLEVGKKIKISREKFFAPIFRVGGVHTLGPPL